MKTAYKVACGCGLGTIFGLLVGNVLGHGIFGITIGFLTGLILTGVIYTYEEIIHFAPIAWKQVSGFKINLMSWNTQKHRIRMLGAFTLLFITVFVDSTTLLYVSFCLTGYKFVIGEFLLSIEKSFLAGLIGGGVSGMIWYLGDSMKYGSHEEDRLIKDNIGPLNSIEKVFLGYKWNVFSAPFTVTFYILKGILWLVQKIWQYKALPFRFAKRLFILIHSDGLVCVLVDTAISISLGFMLNLRSPAELLIGGIIGAGIGLFNYHIVAVRWLKVLPVKA